MKRILSIVLAIVMMLALSVTAFADGEPAGPSVTPNSVNVTKEYTLDGGNTTPGETLEFDVALVSGVDGGVSALPTVGENKDNKVTITSSTELKTDFPINFPTYTKVGVYTYTITEKQGAVLGETYDTTPIYVVVTVTNSSTDTTADELTSTVAIHKGSASAEKTEDSEFKNTFGMGQLTVTKQVSGNLASNTKKFTIKVTFTGGDNAANDITYTVAGGDEKTLSFSDGKAEIDVELSSTQSAVFTNIPAGVTYTVVEDSKHIATAGQDITTTEEGYTVTYTNSDSELKIAAGDKDTVPVNNEKKTEVDTGISLDSLPYVLIAAVVLAASVVMVLNKRRSAEV